MAAEHKNVHYFEWNGNRIVFVTRPTLYVTTRPTFVFDIKNEHSFILGRNAVATIAFVIIVTVCISMIICILHKLRLWCRDRPCRPIVTPQISSFPGYSETTMLSLIEMHALNSNSRPQDQPPNYYDVTLTSTDGDYTPITDIPESPPPNYEEHELKTELDLDKC